MPSYCCFFCPAQGTEDRELESRCASCGRPFGFPLQNQPAEIGPYRVLSSLGRGFYAATYIATRKTGLRTKVVLKVTPKSFYEFFGKNFANECLLHEAIADGTEHLVKIRDMVADVDVLFGPDTLTCCVAELDYIEGALLTEYLDGTEQVTAQTAAQIAIDLLRLREELESRAMFHNDLHAGNIIIERLPKERQRANAVEPRIRAVAIDLGSAAERSRSDPVKNRVGDLTWIADHMARLVSGLLRDPDRVSDHDFRLASAVQSIFHVIAAPAENTRLPAAQELINQINHANAMLPRHNWRSWHQPLALSSFGSYYNALTLEPWHVPALLIDPRGSWLGQISTPGPQVITGMRGCGKTMLLRALQFHARASKVRREEDTEVIERISNDGYVGLFVSAQRLLDKATAVDDSKADPFARLLLAYALEAVRSTMHLKDIKGHGVSDRAHMVIAAALQHLISGLSNLTESIDLDDLDFRISRALVQHSRSDDQTMSLQSHAAESFAYMAEAIRSCAEQWRSAQVLYLLDDVSTRYLKGSKIKQLLSALLFQHPACAFKITSEVQTMELELRTPGENLPAREGRDYSVFDLGSAVYDEIKGNHGRNFVEDILAHRAQHFSAHPPAKPSQLLGDENLEVIATEIAESSATSNKRKRVYRGITALAHVCVGDIGDVISLYERIVKAASGKFPVPAEIQSNCFQDHCSHRLYDLNRRGGYLKDVARSFAEASYELLVRSLREAKKDRRDVRLRQYSSIYIRMTTGDTDKQMNQLRDLIDAGVFVFTGGRPRTKTKDSDPILQFKLTFRRIYGLTNFIGLAERDRFELSGAGLEEWLSDPSRGKEVLLRNLGGGLKDEDGGDATETRSPFSSIEERDTSNEIVQEFEPTFFDRLDIRQVVPVVPSTQSVELPMEKEIQVENLTAEQVVALRPTIIVMGLGFEDRTLASTERILSFLPPTQVFAVEYDEIGKAKEIGALLREWKGPVQRLPYQQTISKGIPIEKGIPLVDVTGLAKPAIFHAVRRSLLLANCVVIAHTRAKSYYPTETDMKDLLRERANRQRFFEELAKVLTGEEAPYTSVPLLDGEADETRRNVLVAFASPKHERLLSLVDSRVIDRLEVVVSNGNTARNRVARQIAEIAAADSASSNVTLIDTDDAARTTEFLLHSFYRWYVQEGFNFEIGLTGSKMEAVAASAMSAICKVTQCWYVRPQKFDSQRFTRGSGETRYLKIWRRDPR